MKRLNGLNYSLIIAIVLAASAALFFELRAVSAGQDAAKKEYVCPPCGCSKDSQVFGQPGYCPACAMALVEKGEAAQAHQRPPQAERKKVAILIFDGVQIIDYTGPYEVFGQAGFQVFTVATSTNPITTAMGMTVVPKYSLDEAPKADVLVIPGGGVNRAQDDPAVIKWIQDKAADAEQVLTVCNGAFILARTGLLDGLSATTFYNLIDGFSTVAPKTKVVSDQRYVDNGKIITTAGISSGIDGSLYVVSKMRGKAVAQMVALNMEYNWQPDSKYARASFADKHLRKLFSNRLLFAVPAGADLKVLSTAGGPDKWEATWEVQGKTSAEDVIRMLNDKLAIDGKWTLQNAGRPTGEAQSAWRFTDEKGGPWRGLLTVQPSAAEKEKLTVTLRIHREGRD